MRITVHWSVCVLERRAYQLRWAEYDFAPLAAEDRRSGAIPGEWRHYRLASVGIVVEAPVGSRVVTVRRPATSQRAAGDERRLSVWWEPYRAPHGLDAETVAWMATREVRGFRVVGRQETVARRRHDDGPGLFAAEPASQTTYELRPPGIRFPEPVQAPTPSAARPIRAEIAAIAAEVLAEADRPIRDAARRALAQLRAATERDEICRIETARTILETALEDCA